MTEDWTPAFPGQRPPFEEGNDLALRHGATSPTRVKPRAEAIAREAVAAVPYLGTPDFTPAVNAWARAEASLELLAEHVDRHGLVDEQGRPFPFVTTLLKFERLATSHRARLGLDPTSRARLERELAETQSSRFDLETMLEKGREVLAARGDEA